MKNPSLFLIFFALLLISKAQNTPQSADKVIVIVLNNEDQPDMNAVVDAVIARANEEAVVIVPTEELVVGTFGEVTAPVGETVILPIGETPLPSVEEAVITPVEAVWNVINTTNKSGSTLTIQAPPAPANTFVSSAQAKENYGQVASRLSGVNGLVLVTDPYNTIRVLNASDLATAFSYVAGNLSDSGPALFAPNEGNIQFVLLKGESVTSSLGSMLPSPY